jgi:hypothetical protein
MHLSMELFTSDEWIGCSCNLWTKQFDKSSSRENWTVMMMEVTRRTVYQPMPDLDLCAKTVRLGRPVCEHIGKGQAHVQFPEINKPQLPQRTTLLRANIYAMVSFFLQWALKFQNILKTNINFTEPFNYIQYLKWHITLWFWLNVSSLLSPRMW